MSEELVRIWGIGAVAASRLFKAGISTIEQVANAKPAELAFVKGIGMTSAEKIIANAKHLMTLERGLTIVLNHIKANFVQHCPKCGGAMKDKYIILGPERRLSAYQCELCKFYLPR
ncbi:MAG: helix-hairpin-helix domain-containing protein [Candidatus Hodarchaeota archaeon]